MSAATLTKREANGRGAENEKPAPPAVDKQALIDGLNHDLAGEYQILVFCILCVSVPLWFISSFRSNTTALDRRQPVCRGSK